MDTSITPQNLAEDRGLKLRQSFLRYPGETTEVDYKAPAAFVSGDDFSLMLVKHVLGMANSGGGYLVIGYPEDANGHPEAGIVTAAVLASYDSSTLSDCVEKYIVGTEKIDLKVHKDKHPDTAQIYPVIEIGSFKSRPFFCKSAAGKKTSGGQILHEGALYIRVAGARTIKTASPDEWDQLIDICVMKRQDDFLKKMSTLMQGMGLGLAPTDQPSNSKEEFDAWKSRMRQQAKTEAEAAGFKFEGIELAHKFTSEKDSTLAATELINAMRSSALKNTGWPVGCVMYDPAFKPKPTEKGVRAIIATNPRDLFDYWFLDQDGSFYFFRSSEEDTRAPSPPTRYPPPPERQLWFDTLIWRLSECIEHTWVLARALQRGDEEKMALSIGYIGLKGRSLDSSSANRRVSSRPTEVEEYHWYEEISVGSLAATQDQLVQRISAKIFALFDFTEISGAVIQDIINEYRGRVR